jgi:hypothetical protein
VRGINLISSSAIGNKGLKIIRRLLNNFALGLAIIFLLAGGAVFWLYYYYGKQITLNKTKISLLEKQIQGLNKNESYLRTVDNRFNKIQGILTKGNSKTNFLKYLDYISVPGFELFTLEINSVNKLIKIDFYCQDSQCLTNLNARIEEIAKDKKYSQISFPSLSRGGQNRYTLTMELRE